MTRGGGNGSDNANYRHGMSRTPTYNSYNAMFQRCYNPKAENYIYYGGRGIGIDPEWAFFEKFLEDMGEKPDGYQLDRKDNDGDYCKTNCHWVLPIENSSITRRNVKFRHEDELLTLSEISRRTGIHLETLRSRLKAGHDIYAAIHKEKHSR